MPAMAVTETVILAVISLTTLVVFQRYEGTRRFVAAALKGSTRRRQPISSGRLRTVATLLAILFSIVLALPVVTLILVSFAREGSWNDRNVAGGLHDGKLPEAVLANRNLVKFSSTACRCRQ
jgi:ABC-type Fe3+ transport system permease subunit